MKITITVEDTPQGPHVEADARGNGVLDHAQDSLAALLVANWTMFLRQQALTGAVAVSGEVFSEAHP